ncbi:hypothetical protein Cni_G15197 [Canna indica]|uniref:Uncharacterized protein n=1 Tax=Canna indica TaxID=4628 RepID=A0AAQ3QEN2_9LILI|nr:hypothetical protein Cni_G15197 [Canna indica]
MPAQQAVTPLDDAEPSDSVARESDGDASLSYCFSFRDNAVRGGSSSRNSPTRYRTVSSPADSSFEFFCASGDMCFAEDVFLGGKLRPALVPQPLPPWRVPSDRRRADFLVEKHQRPRKVASVAGAKVDVRPAAAAVVKLQPKWYLFVLGPMRVPAATEMGDIRSRLRKRRTPPPAGRAVGPSSGGKSGPWRLLRSMSCNGMESAAVEPRHAVQLTAHVAV